MERSCSEGSREETDGVERDSADENGEGELLRFSRPWLDDATEQFSEVEM